jgi:hypothetical protein
MRQKSKEDDPHGTSGRNQNLYYTVNDMPDRIATFSITPYENKYAPYHYSYTPTYWGNFEFKYKPFNLKWAETPMFIEKEKVISN